MSRLCRPRHLAMYMVKKMYVHMMTNTINVKKGSYKKKNKSPARKMSAIMGNT